MNYLKLKSCAALALLALAGASVAASYKDETIKLEKKAAVPQAAETAKAIAVLRPTEGNKVYGWVTFTKAGNAIKVTGEVEGLTPGKHGFHVHQFGDCSAKDATSAGDHFNPQNKPHAAREAKDRHTGDLGNLEAGADGKARIDLTDSTLKLDGVNSIIGRSLIVHAQADDLKTQPTGNAGGRLACAAIGIAKP